MKFDVTQVRRILLITWDIAVLGVLAYFVWHITPKLFGAYVGVYEEYAWAVRHALEGTSYFAAAAGAGLSLLSTFNSRPGRVRRAMLGCLLLVAVFAYGAALVIDFHAFTLRQTILGMSIAALLMMPCSIFGIGVVSLSIKPLSRWRRTRGRRCTACGYDLRGAESSEATRCPECGVANPHADTSDRSP